MLSLPTEKAKASIRLALCAMCLVSFLHDEEQKVTQAASRAGAIKRVSHGNYKRAKPERAGTRVHSGSRATLDLGSH